MDMENPGYDDTDMTREEFHRRLDAGIPAEVNVTAGEVAIASTYVQAIGPSINEGLTEPAPTLFVTVSGQIAEVVERSLADVA